MCLYIVLNSSSLRSLCFDSTYNWWNRQWSSSYSFPRHSIEWHRNYFIRLLYVYFMIENKPLINVSFSAIEYSVSALYSLTQLSMSRRMAQIRHWTKPRFIHFGSALHFKWYFYFLVISHCREADEFFSGIKYFPLWRVEKYFLKHEHSRRRVPK